MAYLKVFGIKFEIMQKLKKLQITNFRSCINTTVDFETNLNALIGVNGAGKTNVLNAIVLLSRAAANRRRLREVELLNKQDSAQTTLNLNLDLDGKEIQIKALLFYETDESSEAIVSTKISYKLPKNKIWKHIESPIFDYPGYAKRHEEQFRLGHADGFFEYYSRRREIKDLDIKIKIATYLNNISYYTATQFSDPSKSPVSFELENERLVNSTTNSKSHEAFLRDLYRSWAREVPFQRFMNIVGANGLQLIEDIDFADYLLPSTSYKVLVGGKLKNIERNKRIVVPSVQVDGLKLSFSQLSEGTFKTLALIFYIINDESDLLIIEEPEVCVHHGLLASIVELIKIQSKKKQIIISTHSDYLVDKLQPENIILVKKDKEKGTTATSLEKSMFKSDFNYLKEYLENEGNLGDYWRESGFENE